MHSLQNIRPSRELHEIIKNFSFARFIFRSHKTKVKLYEFCYASLTWYGACSYIRYLESNNKYKCVIFCFKSRVAQLEKSDSNEKNK